jgi:hypothetical protein
MFDCRIVNGGFCPKLSLFIVYSETHVKVNSIQYKINNTSFFIYDYNYLIWHTKRPTQSLFLSFNNNKLQFYIFIPYSFAVAVAAVAAVVFAAVVFAVVFIAAAFVDREPQRVRTL